MPTIILSIAIAAYSAFVISKRVREIKAGKLCSCSDCGGHCSSCKGCSK